MAEYIDREALITKFKKMELGEHGLVERLFADGVYAVIAAFPSADVAPAVHGKWLRSDDDWDSLTTIRCSICGEEWCFEMIDDVVRLNYKHCPNCGAKMDKERKDTQ